MSCLLGPACGHRSMTSLDQSSDLLISILVGPGLQYGTKACCGYGGDSYNYNREVFCGYSKWIDGKQVTATSCEDPQSYVSWDGIHITEAASKLLVSALLNANSSYFDPPFSFQNYCDIQKIG